MESGWMDNFIKLAPGSIRVCKQIHEIQCLNKLQFCSDWTIVHIIITELISVPDDPVFHQGQPQPQNRLPCTNTVLSQEVSQAYSVWKTFEYHYPACLEKKSSGFLDLNCTEICLAGRKGHYPHHASTARKVRIPFERTGLVYRCVTKSEDGKRRGKKE